MFPRMESGRNQLWELSPQPCHSLPCFFLPAAPIWQKEAWTFSGHCPVSTRCFLGPSVGHEELQGLLSRLPPLGLLAGSPEAACVGAGRGGLKVGAGSLGAGLREAAGPASLSFYELQREAKFPQPPNETESKSQLIGNRREREDWPGESWGQRRGGIVYARTCVRGCMCECGRAENTGMWPGQQWPGTYPFTHRGRVCALWAPCPAQAWGGVCLCLLSSLVQAPTQALDQGEANEVLTFNTKRQGVPKNLSRRDK